MARDGCADCEVLRSDLAQVRVLSHQQACRDHHKCALMFQQLQQLAKLNASLLQRCGVSSDRTSSALEAREQTARGQQSVSFATRRLPAAHERYTADRERDRLQALVVQQEREINELREKLSSSITIPADCQVRASALIFDATGDSIHDETSCGDNTDERFDTNSTDDCCTTRLRLVATQGRQNVAPLRTLPLTSLHAQLKRRDAEIQRLQQLASTLEEHASAVVAKKLEVARNYQQITRVQQQQLKKYFALLRRLGAEKRALEGKLSDVNAYVAVLEKKVVSAAREDRDTSTSDNKSASAARLREWDASVKPKVSTRRTQPPEAKRLGAASFILNVCAG